MVFGRGMKQGEGLYAVQDGKGGGGTYRFNWEKTLRRVRGENGERRKVDRQGEGGRSAPEEANIGYV